MARAFTGKYRGKSTPWLLAEAQRLREKGHGMEEIASRLVRVRPGLKSLSKATASCWSRGLVVTADVAAAINKKAKSRKIASEAATTERGRMTKKGLALSLRVVARLVDEGEVSDSHRRRLVRLMREIVLSEKRETKNQAWRAQGMARGK